MPIHLSAAARILQASLAHRHMEIYRMVPPWDWLLLLQQAARDSQQIHCIHVNSFYTNLTSASHLSRGALSWGNASVRFVCRQICKAFSLRSY